MRSLGHDPGPLLARCGSCEAMLADEYRRVPLQSAFDLLALSTAATGLQDFGLRAAQVQDVGALGPLALAMQNAPTVAASIGYPTRYLSVQSAALQYGPKVLDHGLALAHLTLRLLAGERYALLRGSLRARPAGLLQAHARFFGAPIHGAQPFAALHLSPAMLPVPVQAARSTLLRIAADYLQRHAPAPDAALAAAVRQLCDGRSGRAGGLLGAVGLHTLLSQQAGRHADRDPGTAPRVTA